MASLEFELAGQKYLVRSEENDLFLKEVAEMVQVRVKKVLEASPKLPLQKAAMLVAFDLAGDLIRARQNTSDHRAAVLSKATQILSRIEQELQTDLK